MQILRFLFRLSWGFVFTKVWHSAFYVGLFAFLGFISALSAIALFGARWADATYGLRIALVGWVSLWLYEVIWPQIQLLRLRPDQA